MLNVRLACDHLFGKLLFTWLSLVMSMMVSFVLSFFPRDVLDEILNLIESVSEDFPSYSFSYRPYGGQQFTNSNTGIHAHHTYKHIASTFSTILEFRTSARFRLREWLCNDDLPWSEKKKTKKNPPQKNKNN